MGNLTGTEVVKSSGDRVPFDVGKLRLSLERSGAGEAVIDMVIGQITSELYPGISTKKIYKRAFSLLRKNARPCAARYKLKRAIIELGPTGYPFEQFVGALLRYQGYQVEVGVMVKGHCVMHEVDVVAARGDRHFMVECKFHSDPNRKCGVQVPLYIQSRFIDLKRQWEKRSDHEKVFHQGWVVINTRFSEDAIRYGNCMGLNLIGWNYPRNGSLKERIDTSGLHPVTCLNDLNKGEKQRLLNKGVVLCRQLQEQPRLLDEIHVDPAKQRKVLHELKQLCRS